MEKVSKIQIGCSKYDIQDSEARQLIQELRDSDILSDIDINATVDSNTGTPNVHVDKGENSFTLNFTGLKGETGPRGEKGERGDRGEQGNNGNDGRDGKDGKDGVDGRNGITPHLRATASVGNTIGVPNVEVSVSGTDEEPIFNFWFNGIRGKDGHDGVDGTNGKDGVDGRDGRDGVDGKDGTAAQITNEMINNIKDRVIQAIGQLDDEIEDKVTELVNDANWWQTHFPEGVIGSESNFGEENVKEYLQRIGLWFTDDGTTYTKWSQIRQTYDGIYNDVNQLKANQGVGGTVDYEALAGSLFTYITGETVTSGLQATWAHFLGLGDDTIQMLEWMASGVRAQANSESAVAGLFAAAAEHDETGEIARAALAGVNAIVDKDSNGNYHAKADFVSSVAGQIDGSLEPVSTAGLASEAYVDSAVASLFADNGAGRAYVTTYVNNAMSNVTISADNINLNGRTWADIINADAIIASKINANNIVASGLSGLSSSKVSVNGNGIVVSDGSNATSVLPGQVQLGSSGIGTNYVANGSFVIGYLSYSSSDNVLNCGSINANNNVAAGTIVTGRIQDSSNTSSISLTGNSGGAISMNANVVVANGNVISSSDESLKNIIKDTEITVEDIASTRTVDYELKSNTGDFKSGAIAQDWQSILPNVVKTIDEEQHLGLDYGSAALISAVVDAREIVKLKQENEELKQRLAAIEARLANL